jgi:hypothetical protein
MLTNRLTTTRATLMGHRKGKLSFMKHQPTQMQMVTEMNSVATRM